ncbi:MAG: UDP-3-O-acyl-N-acetylglucosamine deacetylase [Planctomycetaceae bacterium]
MATDLTSPSFQQTLARPAVVSGRGLFHGIEAKVRLLPAEENTGIVFRRTDLKWRPEVRAHVDFVSAAARRTILESSNGAVVETIEHLMAALAGLRIDNCVVEINAIEVPAVDGSCLPFCDAILEAGINQQSATRSVLVIDEPQCVNDRANAQWIEAIPSMNGIPTVDYQLNYGPNAPFCPQSFAVQLTPEQFLNEIAAARTFVLVEEVEALQARGFGRHLTGKDLVVFNADGTVIDNKLRWPDEPVRHKILDCIGDLALCGRSFSGHVVASRSGHKLNHVMAKTLSTIEQGSPMLSRAA